MENFNNNKERKNLFKRVDKMKKMQEGKSAKVKTKPMQKLLMMIAVLVLIIMLILMVFRQNAILISRQNPEYYRAMTYPQVQPGEEATNSEYVTFDAYFLKDINNDGNADKVRGTCLEYMNETDDLYMELNVLTNGYLKDAKIAINSYYNSSKEDSGNFYFTTSIAADSQVKNDYVSNNTREIEFNQLNDGTHILLSGKINYGAWKENIIYNKDQYSKINSIVLTGTHVEVLEDGTTKETQIEKKVEFQVDWYGTLNVNWYSYYSNKENDADIILDTENNLFNVQFKLYLQDSKGSHTQLIFKTGHIEGILPEINGYAPTEVKLTTNNYGSNISYDRNTRKFVIESNDFSYSDYVYYESIEVSYPIEAYNSETDSEKSVEVQVKGWVEGYNNPNEEFKNPYKSNESEATLKIKLMKTIKMPNISVWVNNMENFWLPDYDISSSYISKEKPARIYNGMSKEEKEDYYNVQWRIDSRGESFQNGIIMKESKDDDKSDEFIKSDGSIDSMENLTTNVGIYFSGALNELLGENGWIKIYDDETDELLEIFTKKNWSQYNYSNPYKYSEPVKHIRLETSKIIESDDSFPYIYIYI